MGSLLIVVIALLLLGAPVAVLVWLVTRRRPLAEVPEGMLECRACGKAIAVSASACPSCSEPLG